jgi:hypothetical protein
MQNIFWGAAVIAIGLYFDQSIFYGDFTVLNLVFDGLGLFWITKGVVGLLRRNGSAGPAA